jgi:hypothetical protein
MGFPSHLPNTPTLNSNTSLWRNLYVAALFESDSSVLPERIAKAEAALVRRARELFYAPGDHIEEEQALDDAMYALQALRSTYQFARLNTGSDGAAA